jgi:hypothetical protein
MLALFTRWHKRVAFLKGVVWIILQRDSLIMCFGCSGFEVNTKTQYVLKMEVEV